MIDCPILEEYRGDQPVNQLLSRHLQVFRLDERSRAGPPVHAEEQIGHEILSGIRITQDRFERRLDAPLLRIISRTGHDDMVHAGIEQLVQDPPVILPVGSKIMDRNQIEWRRAAHPPSVNRFPGFGGPNQKERAAYEIR